MLRKKGRCKKLTLSDKVEAVYMVLVEKEYQLSVAKHFRVTPAAISTLVK